MSRQLPKKPDLSLNSPRILCLHGGGVTAEAFKLQSRALISKLQPTFRLVFADGPFFCDPGPGILPVFADFAPFRRWLRWLPEHKEIDAETAVEEIHYQLKIAMDEDEGTGPWVGLMGFSQGAKVSAALLYDQQLQAKNGTDTGLPAWKFAVLLAGRAPLVSLSAASKDCKALVDAAEISEGFTSVEPEAWDGYEKLKLPTIHVHGLTDPGLHLHRRLLDQYCEGPDARRLIEWEGEHRVPIKSKDVEKIVEEIIKVGRETHVIE